MRGYILTFVLLFAALTSSVAFAQTSTTSATIIRINQINAEKIQILARVASATAEINARTENTAAKIASTTADIQSKREELKSDIEKRIGKNLDIQRTAIAQKFEDTLKIINNLIIRTESRISKMQASGTDVTLINTSLDTTKSDIVVAEADLTNLENMLAQPIATSTRSVSVKNLEIQSNKTKVDTETAYTSLIKVINSLTQASIVRATSTKTIRMYPMQKNQSTTTKE